MKVTPSNQTLILASEQRGPGCASVSSFAKTAVPTGSILKRVTIVASQPDTVVYLRADYSTDADIHPGETAEDTERAFSGPAASGPPASDRAALALSNTSHDEPAAYVPAGNAASGQRDVAELVPWLPSAQAQFRVQNLHTVKDGFGNAVTSSRNFGLSFSLPPVQQYARTQRILADTPLLPIIDVHA